jgi:hypothetical protein
LCVERLGIRAADQSITDECRSKPLDDVECFGRLRSGCEHRLKLDDVARLGTLPHFLDAIDCSCGSDDVLCLGWFGHEDGGLR